MNLLLGRACDLPEGTPMASKWWELPKGVSFDRLYQLFDNMRRGGSREAFAAELMALDQPIWHPIREMFPFRDVAESAILSEWASLMEWIPHEKPNDPLAKIASPQDLVIELRNRVRQKVFSKARNGQLPIPPDAALPTGERQSGQDANDGAMIIDALCIEVHAWFDHIGDDLDRSVVRTPLHREVARAVLFKELMSLLKQDGLDPKMVANLLTQTGLDLNGLALMCRTNKAIAEGLGCSYRTVDRMIERFRQEIDLKASVERLRRALIDLQARLNGNP
jgi:hypothetical protein